MTEKPFNKKRALEFGSGLWVALMTKMLEMEKLVKQEVQIKQERKTMNKLIRIASLAVFVLGLGYSAVSYAADEFDAAQDHATLAGLYEKKAAEQNSLINQHERMVNSDFIRKNPSATAQNEMRQHCGAIMAMAKGLKAELLSASEWHKKQ